MRLRALKGMLLPQDMHYLAHAQESSACMEKRMWHTLQFVSISMLCVVGVVIVLHYYLVFVFSRARPYVLGIRKEPL